MGFIYNKPTIAVDEQKECFQGILIKGDKDKFEQLILIIKNLFITNRNSDFIEALMNLAP